MRCCRCDLPMTQYRGRHRISLKELSVMSFKTEVRFWRQKGWCEGCKKTRSDKVDFMSYETPHYTQSYAEWLGTMCEFSPVSRVAKFNEVPASTLRRIDHKRMRQMLKTYRIPDVTHISVDEVYARTKPKHRGEKRDKRFFTVISDLNTRRVIWVTESRDKAALDEFFHILGRRRCEKLQVVAIDQHDAYRASVKDHCPQATTVWDRFHVMQSFNEAVNETRKDLHAEAPAKSDMARLTRGKYRYLFLKKSSRRSKIETNHIDQVFLENSRFCQLEIIKERMHSFFYQPNVQLAKDVFCEIGNWIWQMDFKPLMRWYRHLERNWDTLKNYFEFRVTTSLSEGINNVIKALKRRAYGYRNMDYFRLKIMQVCGYLNSDYAGKQAVT